MTTHASRYSELSPRAHWFLENFDELDLAEFCAGSERTEAVLARIREAAHIADDEDVTDWQRGYRACADRIRAALEEPTA